MFEAINLTHTYRFRGKDVTPLRSFSERFEKNSLIVITGDSGRGKTTLLNSLAGLLRPTAGKILLDGADLYEMNDKERAALRRSKICVVPQGGGLLPGLTAYENIAFHASLSGASAVEIHEKALHLLELANLTNQKDMRQESLSGGEQKRVAVLRALIVKSDYVIADEPTSNLDANNRRIILSLLRKAADEGAGVILASHEADSLSYADREIHLSTDDDAQEPLRS